MIGYVPLPQRRQAPVMVTAFGGLDRNPDAALGTWADEINLSSARSPRMAVRKNRVPVDGIDGNEIGCGVIAACGELDRIALLDEYGRLWSGGNSIQLLSLDKTVRTDQGARIAVDDPTAAMTYFGGVAGKHTLVYTTDIGTEYWEDKDEHHTYPVNKDLSNIGMHWTDGTETARIPGGTEISVLIGFANNRQMVAMGGYVVALPDKTWANAVKLASGAAMVSGTDYGEWDAAVQYEEPMTGTAPEITFFLCHSDGTPVVGATAGDTSPASPAEGDLWIDTGDHALKKYDSDGQWTAIPTTLVRISATGIGSGFRKGDGIALYQRYLGHASGIWDNDEYDYQPGGKSVCDLFGDYYGNEGKMYVLRDVTANSITIDGILDVESLTATMMSVGSSSTPPLVRFARESPAMDYIVESGNRLWGCRYGLNERGEVVNEIYASALGDIRNWRVYDGLSTDSYAASRGTDGAFTGAAVLDGHPLFFRAGSVEKVFPSASGAHQISTQTLDGVEPGSDKSLCIIDNVLYYKSRRGVMAYTGTLPRLVSGALGSERYSSGVFGRDGKRLYCSMLPEQGEREIYVYDTERGEWHREDGTSEMSMTVWRDALYMLIDGQLVKASGGEDSRGVRWEAETPEIGLDVLGRKWISHVQLFCQMELGASASVLVSYDGGNWHRKGRISGNRMGTQTVEVYPHRCERLRLRLEGVGGFELVRLAYRVEEGGDRP